MWAAIAYRSSRTSTVLVSKLISAVIGLADFAVEIFRATASGITLKW